MTESSQTLLQQFKLKKSEKDSVALQEARRLVNLYRSLSCLGDDFLNEYNQMLLEVKPSVKRLLTTFMGGSEVEDYVEFLQENAHLSKTEGEQQNISGVSQAKGYLPSPEADIAMRGQGEMMTVSKEEWEKMKLQNETLLKKLKGLSNIAKTIQSSASDFSTDDYSEIIEDISGDQNNE